MALTNFTKEKTIITINGQEIGFTDFKFTKNYEEVEARDTKSTTYLAGKHTGEFSGTYHKDVETANLALKTKFADSTVKMLDDAGKFALYTGDITLFTEENGGTVDGMAAVNVTGKISEYIETNG